MWNPAPAVIRPAQTTRHSAVSVAPGVKNFVFNQTDTSAYKPRLNTQTEVSTGRSTHAGEDTGLLC